MNIQEAKEWYEKTCQGVEHGVEEHRKEILKLLEGLKFKDEDKDKDKKQNKRERRPKINL
jgi:hypothetical protein